MARGFRFLCGIVGDGALAGLAVGLAYGAWAVDVNRDISHGAFVLALCRIVDSVLLANAAGVAVSAVIAALLAAGVRRGERAARRASAALVLLAMAAAIAALFPFRETVLPLHVFASRSTTLGVAAVLCASLAALVAARVGAAASSRRRAVPRSVAIALLVAPLGGLLAVRAAVHLPQDAYSVLLVSIDTLRADRVGALGGTRNLTPALDRLAREGVLFTAAESTAPWTLPAHASLFTSQLPSTHRVRALGARIPPQQEMLAERFRDAGYRTGAFTAGGYLDAWTGFAQGFETFAVFSHTDDVPTERIADAAANWIGQAGARPFFAFVHTYAPHVPYRHAELADPADAGRLDGAFSWQNLEAVRRGDLVLTASERRYVTDLYDGGVAYADRALGGLFEALRDRGILDRTIVVVLSDHGEELWDHGSGRCPDHGHSVYEELTHVPLLIRAPGVAAGTRIDRPVSLLDVAPTVLHLAGLAAVPSYEGTDLADTCSRGVEPPLRPVFSESTNVGPDRYAVRIAHRKAIVTRSPRPVNAISAPTLEVFDLLADPAERRPLTSPAADPDQDLVAMLGAHLAAIPEGNAAPPSRAPAALAERLRALGYTR